MGSENELGVAVEHSLTMVGFRVAFEPFFLTNETKGKVCWGVGERSSP